MIRTIGAMIRSRKIFFISLCCLLAITIFFIITTGNISFAKNNPHPFLLNVFFVNYTFMGDAVFAILLSAFFIFYLKRKQQGLALFYGFFIAEAVVQVIKNIESYSGPGLFTEQGQYLFSLSNDHESIISGHTAIAFALITVLVFTINNSRNQLILLFAAGLLGYSRIYLAQHSLADVLLGAITGTASAVMSIYLIYQFKGYPDYYKKLHNINKGRIYPGENIQPI